MKKFFIIKYIIGSDIMAFISGYDIILKNKVGIIFNFHLNKQKHIEYIESNTKGVWTKKCEVINEPTESFHVEIDHNNHIHIVSFHSNGNLYYSHFNNDQWENHLIVQYPISDQKILYPTIKYINSQIHIFYYLVNIKDKKKSYLLHLNFNNKNYTTNHITTVFSHSYINPFKIFIKDNEIILLYGSVVNEFDQIFVSKLNLLSGKWDDPKCITSSKDKKIYINGLLDNNKTLHIIWSKYDEKHLVVQYLNLDTDKFDVDTSDLEPISLSNKSSCSFPALSYYKNILWSTWAETNKVASCYSTDLGKTWSKPFIHEDTRKIDFKRYRYVSNSSENKNNILCDFVFGSPYPNIQFLGFGGETNDDIPTS